MPDATHLIPEEKPTFETESRAEKEVYEPPDLIVHGTLEDLTQDSSDEGVPDIFIGFAPS